MEKEYRKADASEHRRILQNADEIISDRRIGMLCTNGLFLIPIFLISLFVCVSKVRGESQLIPGIITFVVLMGIMAGIDLLVDLTGKRWKKELDKREYQITDAKVIDKEHISGRSYSEYKVELAFENGDTEDYNIPSIVYAQTKLGTRVMVVQIDTDYMYRTDIVVREEDLIKSVSENRKEVDYDDDEEYYDD